MNNQSITISKIIHGGYGLGKLDNGQAVMVRHVLPGEEVTFSTKEMKKNYIVGSLKNIEQESESRVQPFCEVYRTCGGCDLQHSSYPAQLQIKTDIVTDLLHRQFGRELSFQVEPAIASPITRNYRQRIRLQVGENEIVGFHKHQSHAIIEIDECPIARPELNKTLASLKSCKEFYSLLSNTTELELLHNPCSEKTTVIFSLQRKPRPQDFNKARNLLEDCESLERLYFRGEQFPLTLAAPKEINNQFSIQYSEINLDNSPFHLGWEVGGFCQVNLEQNQTLISKSLEFAAPKATDTILDLFCGSGNFSIPIAAHASSVVGIEGQGAAIRSAKKNSQIAGLANTDFRKSPIHKACKDLVDGGHSFDCLIIDPPRQGVPGLAKELSLLCKSRMVYISCDPATLCRDLFELEKHDFSIQTVQPIDMFPQTHHIETIVLLEKN